MARIRTIKPEFWTSPQIVACTVSARLLFMGLWSFCDDGGVHVDDALRIKMEVFPADPFTAKQVEVWLGELESNGLIERYVVNGSKYLRCTGWDKHQKVDQATYRHPLPNGEIKETKIRRRPDNSPNVHRTDAERSPNVRGRNGIRVSSSNPEQVVKSKQELSHSFPRPRDLDEVLGRGKGLALPPSECSAFLTFWTARDWIGRDGPIKKWELALGTWARNYFAKGGKRHDYSEPRYLSGEDAVRHIAALRGEA